MYISELKLESFKSYENMTLKFDKRFNVIIGENNIGKSTIFEALQLWKKCYDLSISAKGDKFYSKTTTLYINFEDLHFIRLSSDEDILYPDKTSCNLKVTFAEEINDILQYYTLDFTLTKPNIKNAYVRIIRGNEDEFDRLLERLSQLNIKLREFIFIHQTSPVSNVLSKEPYMFKGQVIKKIQKGKSDEVLRNKILQSLEKGSQLEEWMQEVLDVSFCFIPPKRSERDKSEYIKLLVDKDGSKLDMYLQGSGFLQTAEIFSTIEVMNNALNILLIDEPDSHITPRIQNRLLCCLNNINETQTFIISHNDNFVADVAPEHILFVNSTNKVQGTVEPLEVDNVDVLHITLGGIITGLTRLQKYKVVFFVEGEDDISYIRMLSNALKRIGSEEKIEMEKLSFWFIRGKDNLNIKIMAGKQLLSQAVTDCRFNAIFDKDFATLSANESYINTDVKRRLGNSCIVHTHNGYCIESVLFSNLELLKSYLDKLLPNAITLPIEGIIPNPDFDLSQFIQGFCDKKRNDIRTVGSPFYQDMKNRFNSQKKPQRPELNNVDFDDFAAEASGTVQFLMNKRNIAEFVLQLENEIAGQLFDRDDDGEETLSSKLLIHYFMSIETDDDIIPGFLELVHALYL